MDRKGIIDIVGGAIFAILLLTQVNTLFGVRYVGSALGQHIVVADLAFALLWIGTVLCIGNGIRKYAASGTRPLRQGTPGLASSPAPTFHDEPALTNDAYRIFLTRRFSIERNDALGKVICNDKLFDSIDLALAHADELYKAGSPARSETAENPKLTATETATLVRAPDATIKRKWEHRGRNIYLYSDKTASIYGVDRVFPTVADAKNFLDAGE